MVGDTIEDFTIEDSTATISIIIDARFHTAIVDEIATQVTQEVQITI